MIREKVCRLNIRKAFLLDYVRFKTAFDSACSFQVKSRGIKKCCGIKKSRVFFSFRYVSQFLFLSFLVHTSYGSFLLYKGSTPFVALKRHFVKHLLRIFCSWGKREEKRGTTMLISRARVIFACRVYFLLFFFYRLFSRGCVS